MYNCLMKNTTVNEYKQNYDNFKFIKEKQSLERDIRLYFIYFGKKNYTS